MASSSKAMDTIAAIATPAGRGGVGIVRVSGPNCRQIASAILGTVLAVDFSWTSGLFVLITTWFWVALGAVVLAGPILYAIRVPVNPGFMIPPMKRM